MQNDVSELCEHIVFRFVPSPALWSVVMCAIHFNNHPADYEVTFSAFYDFSEFEWNAISCEKIRNHPLRLRTISFENVHSLAAGVLSRTRPPKADYNENLYLATIRACVSLASIGSQPMRVSRREAYINLKLHTASFRLLAGKLRSQAINEQKLAHVLGNQLPLSC